MEGTEELHSSYIANCVFNGFLSYTTIMLNVITIHAIRKTSSLPNPLKTLLLSLAVSDLGVGLLVQPLLIAVHIMELKQNVFGENNPSYNTTNIAIHVTGNLFSHVSFFGVSALSADRFLAIHLHLRYQELVTHKRVVVLVISIWMLNAFLSLMTLCIPNDIIFMTFEVVEVACVIIVTILNYKIYVVLRRHTNQIQALQLQQAGQHDEMENVRRLRTSAVAIIYVYVVFLACYLPQTTINIIARICGPSNAIKYLSMYTLTLVMLNSSLNPLIYCWKMRHIRHVVTGILRKAFSG